MTNFQPQASHLKYHDIEINAVYSFEKIFSKEEGLAFATLSGDYNPLHLDENFGAQSSLGRNIMHGMLAASLFSQLVGMHCPGEACLYLSQTLNFKNPLYYDVPLKVQGTVIAKTDALQLITLKTEIIQNSQIAVEGVAKAKMIELVR